MKGVLERDYPGIQIAGMYAPPFRALTPQEDAQIVAKINESRPDFIWIGLGAPKQEECKVIARPGVYLERRKRSVGLYAVHTMTTTCSGAYNNL